MRLMQESNLAGILLMGTVFTPKHLNFFRDSKIPIPPLDSWRSFLSAIRLFVILDVPDHEDTLNANAHYLLLANSSYMKLNLSLPICALYHQWKCVGQLLLS